MAHPEQQQWIQEVCNRFPTSFQSKCVLDVGSLDINGSNRSWFNNCIYYGIDLGIGKNVDFVCSGHEFNPRHFNLAFDQFDTIISTECFEHDAHYEDTLKNICNLLKAEGLFTFTCATTGRAEHGTNRTDTYSSPFTLTYYKNLTEEDIRKAIDVDAVFSSYSFDVLKTDLRFWGVKHTTIHTEVETTFGI